MKKIIALAVAGAFVAPAFAADVTISGDISQIHVETNSTTTMESDTDVNLKVATETDAGISVVADVNIRGDVENDGGHSIKLSGDFGSLDIGDTNNTIDEYDLAADYSYYVGPGSGNEADAHVLYVTPSMNGFVAKLSYAADAGTELGGEDTGSGYAVEYSAAGAKAFYAFQDSEDETDNTLAGLTYSNQGISVSFMRGADGAADGTEVKETLIAANYSMGNANIFAGNREEEADDGSTNSDVTTYGVNYALGGGLNVFAETSSDSEDADNDTTALGLWLDF